MGPSFARAAASGMMLLWAAGIAAHSAQVPRSQPQATIRAEVALVNVVFTVVDSRNRPISRLTADDFLVLEDRQPQTVEYFSQLDEASDVLLSVALLIDTSGSVKGKLEQEKTTAAEFFRTVLRKDKDLGLLMQFDSEVNLVQDWTADIHRLVAALDVLQAGNSTALYDAVYLAVTEKLQREAGRKVIVVITDGEDTASRVRKEEAVEVAQRADALIYGVGVRGDFGVNFRVLRKMAEETGGSFFSPRARVAEIQAAFEAINRELKTQYSLAYHSTNSRKDGTFRTIEIRPKIPTLKVKARKGYYAPLSR